MGGVLRQDVWLQVLNDLRFLKIFHAIIFVCFEYKNLRAELYCVTNIISNQLDIIEIILTSLNMQDVISFGK